MTFEEACRLALKYFKKNYGDIGLFPALDIGDRWVFNGDNIKHKINYSRQLISVSKLTGELDLFYLPDNENFKLLEKATEIPVPNKYKIP